MGKPQDLPAGEAQLYVAIILNFLTYVLALVSFAGIGGAALHAAIDIACTGLFLYLALMLTSKLPRFQQSFGAICGAGAILNTAAIPLLQLTAVESAETVSSLAVFSRILLLVWSLSLVAHVLRHTFNMRMFYSVLVALMYYLFITSLLATLFPPDMATSDQLSTIQSFGQYVSA